VPDRKKGQISPPALQRDEGAVRVIRDKLRSILSMHAMAAPCGKRGGGWGGGPFSDVLGIAPVWPARTFFRISRMLVCLSVYLFSLVLPPLAKCRPPYLEVQEKREGSKSYSPKVNFGARILPTNNRSRSCQSEKLSVMSVTVFAPKTTCSGK